MDTQQQRPRSGIAVADDLLLGAGPIAKYIYGEDTDETRRDVYRNPFGFGFFKHGNTLAALKSTIRQELIEAQRAAKEQLELERLEKSRLSPKPRRRLTHREAPKK